MLQKEIVPNNKYESTFLHWLLELGNKNLENLVKRYDQEKQLNFYVKDSQKTTVAEWIANYRMDLLKSLADNGYLNSDNKDENIKILTALVTNTSKVNTLKEIDARQCALRASFTIVSRAFSFRVITSSRREIKKEIDIYPSIG